MENHDTEKLEKLLEATYGNTIAAKYAKNLGFLSLSLLGTQYAGR